MKEKRIYIDVEVLSWTPLPSDLARITTSNIARPYDYWRQAREQLEQREDTDMNRIDSISNMKRASDSRMKLLNDLYKFKKIPHLRATSELMEKLAQLGIMRPKMVQELFNLRIIIEHQFVVA